MGKCVCCGYAVNRADPKGAYRLICTNKGAYKRYGDNCPDFWDEQEVKEFIDETIPLVK